MIESGRLRLAFDPALGGRACSWTVQTDSPSDDTTDGTWLELLTRHSDAPIDHGMYVMAPWAGRIAGNAVGAHLIPANFGPWAIHGTAPWGPATLAEQSADSITFHQGLGGWPFAGSVRTRWSIDGDVLHTAIAVRAHEQAFPASVGWHPWFPRELASVAAVVDLPATQQLLRGDDALPTGELVPFTADYGTYDDALLVPDQRASIRWPGIATIEVHSSSPWFVLFDQLPDAVCIEPQSGPPDALRPQAHWTPMIVTPDAPLELRASWRVIVE